MAVESLITSLLQSLPAVAAVAGGQVYHQQVPQDASLPCVRFERVSGERLKVLAGQLTTTKARYLFDCLADRSVDGRALAAAIKGLAGPQTAKQDGVSPATLKWVWYEDDRDNYDSPVQLDDRGVRHAEVELTLWYTEP